MESLLLVASLSFLCFFFEKLSNVCVCVCSYLFILYYTKSSLHLALFAPCFLYLTKYSGNHSIEFYKDLVIVMVEKNSILWLFKLT